MSLAPLASIDAPPSPGDLLQLPALQTALLELGLLAVAGGLLGAWVVLHRLAFFAHATGTATFPGLVIAQAAGISPRLAGVAVALGFAGGVGRAGRTRGGDLATGLVLVGALALGVVLASDVFESGGGVDRMLFGSALGIGGGDVVASAAAATTAVVATVGLRRAWTTTAFDPDGARALGLRTATVDGLLLALVAAAAVTALPAVGALLVTSLFVVPAATARLLARDVGELLVASVAIAALQAVAGLYVAFWIDVPPGPAIAVVGSLAFVLTALLSAGTRGLDAGERA